MKYCLFILLACLIAACSGPDRQVAVRNSAYYWRTEWHIDSAEQSFLQEYDIRRIYCRYFDVVMDEGEPMPNATIRFSEPIPEGIDMVPTVYITEDCMHSQHKGLARKIVDRVIQMNETHDIRGVSELQMDCDYTARSRQIYFDFLNQLRTEARQHGMRLSVTIRLHQLSMAVPPADYGVLMLYNTGDPRRFYERNPILDRRDVQPYLQHLPDYNLTLAAAYPIFRWQRDIQGVRVEHVAEAGEILQVKQAVERKRADLSQHIITYHLDKENIRRYGNETFEAIYHH